jgi:integrase
MSVAECLRRYITEHVGEKVIDRRRQEIAARHIERHFDGNGICTVDIAASRKYRDVRRLDGVSDATIRRELGVLAAAAEHCLRWRHIGRENMPSIELPMLPVNEAPWLRDFEMAKVLEAAQGRLGDFVRLAYYTASRRGAIERLRRCQIDLDRRTISLRAPNETVLQQRSKKRRPVVPIVDELLPVVARLVNEPSEWLLGSPAPMYRPFRQMMERLGFSDRAHPHVLRHSRATHLLLKGVDIYLVAKLLGDTVATVERVYGHACPDTLRRVA